MEELNVGSGKKCGSCGSTVAAGRKTCHNCGASFTTAVEELGDSEGHPFHGNQYTGGGGGGEGDTRHLGTGDNRILAGVKPGPEEKSAYPSGKMLDAPPPFAVAKIARDLAPGEKWGVAHDGKFEVVGTHVSLGKSIFEPDQLVSRIKESSAGMRVAPDQQIHAWLPAAENVAWTPPEVSWKAREHALAARVDAAETALLSLARLELGDQPGHDFHGNQYTGGGGGSDSYKTSTFPGQSIPRDQLPGPGEPGSATHVTPLNDTDTNVTAALPLPSGVTAFRNTDDSVYFKTDDNKELAGHFDGSELLGPMWDEAPEATSAFWSALAGEHVPVNEDGEAQFSDTAQAKLDALDSALAALVSDKVAGDSAPWPQAPYRYLPND